MTKGTKYVPNANANLVCPDEWSLLPPNAPVEHQKCYRNFGQHYLRDANEVCNEVHAELPVPNNDEEKSHLSKVFDELITYPFDNTYYVDGTALKLRFTEGSNSGH